MLIASRFMKGARCDEDDKLIKTRKFGNKTFTIIASALENKNKGYLKKTPNEEFFKTLDECLSIRKIRREILSYNPISHIKIANSTITKQHLKRELKKIL